MSSILMHPQFLLIAAVNFCLFLVVATWSYLPIILVDWGASKLETGLVMGAIGVTSLGSLPFIAPLIDRYGRKIFILSGIALIGISNAGFLAFHSFSPLMAIVRLVQGLAFAACFNGCATAIVDRIPPEKRAQGIGLFGVSGSAAVCVGPAIGEFTLSHYGEASYFLLLTLFGVIGTILALYLREEPRPAQPQGSHGFFFTAAQDGYMSLMAVAVVFGAGFAAMSTFFPLYAKTLGLQAGVFFVCYGISLISMRLFLGKITDSMNRDKLIVGCLAGFGLMLTGTSQVDSMFQIYLLGFTFGLLQGLSYPTMMARMVDRAGAHNRGVVVALFTGSFGVGINLSTPAWGSLADSCGLSLMFLVGGIIMFAGAGLTYFHNSAVGNSSLEPKRRPS